MAVDINYFLKQKRNQYEINEAIITDDLYDDISNEDLRYLFAVMHQEFNRLIKFMYVILE